MRRRHFKLWQKKELHGMLQGTPGLGARPKPALIRPTWVAHGGSRTVLKLVQDGTLLQLSCIVFTPWYYIFYSIWQRLCLTETWQTVGQIKEGVSKVSKLTEVKRNLGLGKAETQAEKPWGSVQSEVAIRAHTVHRVMQTCS